MGALLGARTGRRRATTRWVGADGQHGPHVLHVDMDAFYAAVEVRRRPELRGRPVVVGGSGRRGVVAAASYEARRFGVHSAMSAVRAQQLCPEAVWLPGDHAHYADVSADVHAILRSFTPVIEPIALDEAFLDVGRAATLFGDGPAIATAIRRRVRTELDLTCSVGVAPIKLVAKLASQAAKPAAGRAGPPLGGVPGRGSGVVVVPAADVLPFLHAHPVEALWGVGPATLRRLGALGVRTVGDLAALPEPSVVATLGAAHGRHLHQLARGVDPRPVEPDRAVRSIGHEETFAHDVHRPELLAAEAVRMADAVAGRLRRHGVVGRTVQVKVRFADFRTITRSHTVAEPLDSGAGVARVAVGLLERIDVGTTGGVRLLGVSVASLEEPEARQLSLDDLAGPGWSEADAAVDRIRDRFGDDAIGPAAILRPGGLRPKRAGDAPWGPAGAG